MTMATFLLAILVVAMAMAGMAVGVILANRRIQGSCGGLSGIEGLDSACELCRKPCRRRRAAQRAASTR